MQNASSPAWPYLSFALPETADGERIACLSQAALDVGALGAAVEAGQILIYLPRQAGEAQIQAATLAVQGEAAQLGWAPLVWQSQILEDQPWESAWRKDFKSIAVGRTLLIRPEWERGEPPPPEWSGRHTIWLRPGFGFGTGRHETTRLALEMLENHLESGARALDFGSGSAILSVAAVRLGAATVTAIERDPDANENARENLALNGCSARVHLSQAERPDPDSGKYDLVVCNMLPQNALEHFEPLGRRLADSHSVLIYCGFLADQEREIEEALARAGLVTRACARMNEWGAFAAGLGRRTG